MSKERLEEIKRMFANQKGAVKKLGAHDAKWLTTQAEENERLMNWNKTIVRINQRYKQVLEHGKSELKFVLSSPDAHNKHNVIKELVKNIKQALQGDTDA